MSPINQRDVSQYIKALGRNFDFAIAGHMLVPSIDPSDKKAVLVLDDEGEATPRDNVLRLVHNAFVKHRIQVPPFESEPFSELLTAEDFISTEVSSFTLTIMSRTALTIR